MPVPAKRIRRRVTLTEIAAATGLALSTVSRALSDPNRVSAESYERIVRKARELGYESASLPQTRPKFVRGTIALLVPNIVNPFNFDVIRGSQAQIQAAGYLHLLVSTDDSAAIEANWLRELAGSVDGVVLQSPRSEEALLAKVNTKLPLVLINRQLASLPSVVIDTPEALAQGVDYLASLDHRRIAYVRGPSNSLVDSGRHEAIRLRCEQHGMALETTGHFSPSLAAGAAAADAVALRGVTGVIFFNDMLAIGALARFAELGIRVPQDMSVIGCDEIFGSALTQPALTTVATPAERAGREATDMLVHGFSSRDRTPRHDRLSAHLIVRASTGPAPVGQ